MPKRYQNKLKEEVTPPAPAKAEPKDTSVKFADIPKRGLKARIASFKASMEKYKVAQLTGLFLILFAVCSAIAFTSFLFTWQVDYDKVTGPLTSLLSPGIKTANWLGNFGALLSNLFINHWFGIAAFGVSFLSFLAGVKLLLNITLLPFAKTLRVTLFVMLWLGVAMGYIFHQNRLFMGGGIG